MAHAPKSQGGCCDARHADAPYDHVHVAPDQSETLGSAGPAKDPVCGMSVDPATAKHRSERGGRTYDFCCGGCKAKFEADPERYVAAASSDGSADEATDPVCGMSVDPATAKHRAEHRGATHYFCSAGCKTKFEADPEKYLTAAAARARARCPRARSTPARCTRRSARRGPAPARSAAWRWSPRWSPPKRSPTTNSRDMTRRFWIGLALAVPVFAAGDGRPPLPADPPRCSARGLGLGPVRARDAGRALGGLAVLPARLGVASSRAT